MFEVGEEEVRAVRKVLLSKKYYRYPSSENGECDQFEREFAAKIGVKHAIILSSGTNALAIALMARGIGPGDEVIVPAYTFVATAAAVKLAGAKPVIANIDENLSLSTADTKAKITPRTKAIIPVHMDGLVADLKGAAALAKAHDLFLLEDCAQALGGSFGKKRLGAFGHAGAFSLNDNKNISCGEGGIVVTNDSALHETMFKLHDMASQYNPVRKKLYGEATPTMGLSTRVSEIQGAIMRVQLKRLDKILARLRERKEILAEAFGGMRNVKVISGYSKSGDCASALHLRLPDPSFAGRASKALIEAGIMAAFPSLRPAHVAWKWMDMIDPSEAKFVTAGLLPSVEIMMSTIKYDVPYDMTAKQTAAVAKKFRAILERV
ncbi:MAG: DegT/DnrJ/EryC1/StrS family aminotransferase [Bdellovibrionota bacterium]